MASLALMQKKMDAILNQPHFQDAEQAREYLEALRWPDGPVCPHCGSVDNHYALHGKAHRPGVWKCKDCREQFSVTVGTVFEASKIPLHKWLQAVYLICSSKKGVSSKQLERTLDVTYKTAWFMSHRIREAMKTDSDTPLGSGGGTVEADETFVGRKPGRKKAKGGFAHKNAVFSLVERNGNVRSFHVADVTATTLKPIIQKQMAEKAKLMTDDAGQYRIIGKVSETHETVAHMHKEYVRGNVHTNTVEGFFSIFKRGIYGTYQHVSSHHLQRYVTEFDFRYNNREKLGVDDEKRTDNALKGIGGKRLTYRRINTQEAEQRN